MATTTSNNRDKKVEREYQAELQRQEVIHKTANLSLIDKVRIKANAKFRAEQKVAENEAASNDTSKK